MKLRYARIQNFRSVEDIRIDFDPRCRFLVGINESGKSNILHALSLLDTKRKTTPEDIREFRPDDDHQADASVMFVFGLEAADRKEVLARANDKILSEKPTIPVVISSGRSLNMSQFVDARNEGLYEIDVRDGSRTPRYWRLPASFEIAEGWYKPSKECPPEAQLTLSDGKQVKIKSYELIHDSSVSGIDQLVLSANNHLIPAATEDVNSCVGRRIAELVSSHLPQCLYWSYDDSLLLPGKIHLTQFAANPSSCEPLRQMFSLAGFDDVSETIADAKQRTQGIRNLLHKVAIGATKHMRHVWRDYKDITIALEPDGEFVNAIIQDEHNVFEFAKRSDGFKRFISFLLLVSAKSKTDELANTLYLHDEPDLSLHPSGVRHLREELIKIAEKNYVVCSTHSIFMVDRDLVRRHYMVTKSSEVTSIRHVDDSNIFDEEVVYNALRYSLFETLRPQNLLFEGWRDKKLFEVAVGTSNPKAKKLKTKFKEIGRCHAKGVKGVENITSILELARRSWIVVSDSDQVAVQYQKQYKGNGPWLRYDELVPTEVALTGEDFLRAEAFKKAIARVEDDRPQIPKFDHSRLQNGKPKLNEIVAWLSSSGIASDELKPLLNSIKDDLFSDLKGSHIEDKYFTLLEELSKRLGQVST